MHVNKLMKKLDSCVQKFDINDIKSYEEYDWSKEKYYVYFLCRDDVVVYVGQTINVVRRMREHRRHLIFDYFYIGGTGDDSKENLNLCEKYFINYCKPILNNKLTAFENYNSGGAKTIGHILEWSEEYFSNGKKIPQKAKIIPVSTWNTSGKSSKKKKA